MDLEGPAALTSHDSRVFLNNRKVSIYGGSNEVQRTIIAGTILEIDIIKAPTAFSTRIAVSGKRFLPARFAAVDGDTVAEHPVAASRSARSQGGDLPVRAAIVAEALPDLLVFADIIRIVVDPPAKIVKLTVFFLPRCLLLFAAAEIIELGLDNSLQASPVIGVLLQRAAIVIGLYQVGVIDPGHGHDQRQVDIGQRCLHGVAAF